MAMAAPMVVRGATAATAGKAAASAGTRAGAASKAGSASKASKAAKAAAVPAPPAPGTAAGRAAELRSSGTSRADAHKALSEEFGGTPAETDDLLSGAGWEQDAPGAGGEAQPARAAQSGRRPSLPKPPKSLSSAAEAGGGVLLGVLGYVLALAYMRDGKAGVKAWLSAKFLNKVTTTKGAR